ncbi:flagellar brake protein [Marinitoga arctica]
MKSENSVFIEKVSIRKIIFEGDIVDVELPQKHIIANSRILSINYISHNVKILPPIYRNSRVKINDGELLNIRVYERSSNYMIKSKVLKIEKDYIYIHLPSYAIKIQKRRFFRIPIIRDGILKDKEEKKFIPFETRDFSAGGMQIACKYNLEEKEYNLSKLEVDENLILEDLPVRVVRIVGENIYNEKLYGIMFLNLDYNLEKQIVRYVNLYTIRSKNHDIG